MGRRLVESCKLGHIASAAMFSTGGQMAQADVNVPPAPTAASAADTDPNKSLDRLYDYTKFHIGAYLTFTAS